MKIFKLFDMEFSDLCQQDDVIFANKYKGIVKPLTTIVKIAIL